MIKSTTDFKVFVSDEILDFRTLDEKHKSKPPAYSKPKSAPSLPDRSDSRSKTRSRTVDPRFRKSRSPARNIKSVSQSTTDINNNSQREKKTQSTGVLNQSRNFQKPPKPDYTTKPATVKKTATEMEFFTHKETRKRSGSRAIPNSAGEYGQDLGDGKFFTESLRVEQLSPKCAGEIFEDITFDEADLPITHNLELDDCLEDKTSSFWDSPKLGRSLQFPKAKTCTDIPTLAETTSNNLVMCRNCLAAQWLFPIYKYDDMTDGNSSVSDVKHKVKGTTSTFYKVLGSIIAIVIVSFLGWILSHLCTTGIKYLPFDLPITRPNTPSMWDNMVFPNWYNAICRKLREIFNMPVQKQETHFSLFRDFVNNLLR